MLKNVWIYFSTLEISVWNNGSVDARRNATKTLDDWIVYFDPMNTILQWNQQQQKYHRIEWTKEWNPMVGSKWAFVLDNFVSFYFFWNKWAHFALNWNYLKEIFDARNLSYFYRQQTQIKQMKFPSTRTYSNHFCFSCSKWLLSHSFLYFSLICRCRNFQLNEQTKNKKIEKINLNKWSTFELLFVGKCIICWKWASFWKMYFCLILFVWAKVVELAARHLNSVSNVH